MYGVTGQDTTMNQFGDNNEHANVLPYADGKGRWEHRFGIYSGLGLLDGDLGISFGYSGGFLSYEKWEKGLGIDEGGSPNEKDLLRSGPFFHGVDLKAQFSGMEKITITAAINASFSSTKGSKFEDDKWQMSMGIGNIPEGVRLDEKQEEGFFGLAAGLNIGFHLTDVLDFNTQIKNSAQWESYIDDDKEFNQLRSQLGVALSLRYRMTEYFSLMGGLAMQMDRITQDGKNLADFNGYKGGDLYFGIPITFHIRF